MITIKIEPLDPIMCWRRKDGESAIAVCRAFLPECIPDETGDLEDYCFAFGKHAINGFRCDDCLMSES